MSSAATTVPLCDIADKNLPIHLSEEKKEVNPELALADVFIDGNPGTSIRLGGDLLVQRDKDLNINDNYNIVSLRLHLTKPLADAIAAIDKQMEKEMPGFKYTPLLDTYDPTNPRLDVRLDIQKHNKTLQTLVFDGCNKPKNKDAQWTVEKFSEFLSDRAVVDAKLSLEAFVFPGRRAYKLLAKAKSLLVRPCYDLTLPSISWGDVLSENILTETTPWQGSFYPNGPSMSSFSVSLCAQTITSGPMWDMEVVDVRPSGTLVRSSLKTDEQFSGITALDTFFGNTTIAEKVATCLVPLGVKDISTPSYQPLLEGKTIQFMVNNTSKLHPENIIFASELYYSKNSNTYSIYLRVVDGGHDNDTAPSSSPSSQMLLPPSCSEWEKEMILGTPRATSTGNSYGSMTTTTDKTKTVILSTGVVLHPEVRRITGDMVVLCVTLPKECQVNFFKKLDKLVAEEWSTVYGQHYTSFPVFRDGVVEFRLEVSRTGKGGLRTQIISSASQSPVRTVEELSSLMTSSLGVNVVFTIEYSLNIQRQRFQLMLKAQQVHVCDNVDPNLFSMITKVLGVQDIIPNGDKIQLSPPREIGDGTCFFGNVIYEDKPLIFDLGVVHYKQGDALQMITDNLTVFRCVPVDSDMSSNLLTLIDNAFKKNKEELINITDAADGLQYYSIQKAAPLIELRCDNRIKMNNGFNETNTAQLTVSIDYSVQPLKGRLQAIVKIKKIKFLPCVPDAVIPDMPLSNSTSSGEGGGGPPMKVTAIEAISGEDITFEKPTEADTSRQKFVLFRYQGKPRLFELDTIILQREGDQSVGLPSQEFAAATGNKLTVILTGDNMKFFKMLDEVMTTKVKEIKSLYELSDKQKLAYHEIVREDHDVPCCKFVLELDGETTMTSAEDNTGGFKKKASPTSFYMNDKNHPVVFTKLEDLEKHMRLGSILKEPVIAVSKVWYDKQSKEYHLRLKLKSCILGGYSGRTNTVTDDLARELSFADDGFNVSMG
jgi:hypothetical protein